MHINQSCGKQLEMTLNQSFSNDIRPINRFFYHVIHQNDFGVA